MALNLKLKQFLKEGKFGKTTRRRKALSSMLQKNFGKSLKSATKAALIKRSPRRPSPVKFIK